MSPPSPLLISSRLGALARQGIGGRGGRGASPPLSNARAPASLGGGTHYSMRETSFPSFLPQLSIKRKIESLCIIIIIINIIMPPTRACPSLRREPAFLPTIGNGLLPDFPRIHGTGTRKHPDEHLQRFIRFGTKQPSKGTNEISFFNGQRKPRLIPEIEFLFHEKAPFRMIFPEKIDSLGAEKKP